MVLQCYDFLADSAIPTDRYLLLCGGFRGKSVCRGVPKAGCICYEGGEPILVVGLTYIGRDDDLYRMAKKAI